MIGWDILAAVCFATAAVGWWVYRDYHDHKWTWVISGTTAGSLVLYVGQDYNQDLQGIFTTVLLIIFANIILVHLAEQLEKRWRQRK
jgi:hypothetical protein